MNQTLSEFDVCLSRGPAELGNDFLSLLDRMREFDPVYWNRKANCWMVTRHQDVTDAFNGKFPLTCRSRLVSGVMSCIAPEDRAKRFPVLSRYLPHVIVDTEAPEHTRLRKLLMQSFTKKTIEDVRPYVREKIASLLAKGVARPEIEFQEEISRPLPGFVIFKMLGIPEGQFVNMREWSNAMMEVTSSIGATEAQIERAEAALAAMNRLGLEEKEKRLFRPQNDLLTRLAEATVDGEKMTDDEFLAQMLILIVAGHESTSSTITMTAEALSNRPDLWDYIYRNPQDIDSVVAELMRFVSMSTAQLRVVENDFQWYGKTLKAGDMVVLAVAAANRDPRVFERPAEIDLARENHSSMVFGAGAHHCIGHLLAKMEVSEFVLAMVNHFSGLDVLDQQLEFMPTAFFRGMFRLNVRFHPRQLQTGR
jgi:cytochrome P450